MIESNEKTDSKNKRPVGRPPNPIPTKPDSTPYTPKEVARILLTTSPQQLDDWQQRRD